MCAVVGRFDDRFESSTYELDPPAGFFPTGYPDADSGVWMPERIFDRLVGLGRAYQLHYLPLLYGQDSEPVILNHQQVGGLIDEVDFLARTMTDPLVRLWSDRVVNLASQVAASGGSLTIDPH